MKLLEGKPLKDFTNNLKLKIDFLISMEKDIQTVSSWCPLGDQACEECSCAGCCCCWNMILLVLLVVLLVVLLILLTSGYFRVG